MKTNGKLRSFPLLAATQMPTCILPTTLKLCFPDRCIISAAVTPLPPSGYGLSVTSDLADFVVIPYLTYSIDLLPDACGWLTHVR